MRFRQEGEEPDPTHTTSLSRRRLNVERFLQLRRTLQELQRSLGSRHLCELPYQHLLVLRHVHFNIIPIDIDVLDRRVKIVPPQPAGLFDIDFPRGCDGPLEPLNDRLLRKVRLKIFRLFIPRLELLDHLSHFPQRFLIALICAEKRHREEYPCTHECKPHPYHSRWSR